MLKHYNLSFVSRTFVKLNEQITVCGHNMCCVFKSVAFESSYFAITLTNEIKFVFCFSLIFR